MIPRAMENYLKLLEVLELLKEQPEALQDTSLGWVEIERPDEWLQEGAYPWKKGGPLTMRRKMTLTLCKVCLGEDQRPGEAGGRAESRYRWKEQVKVPPEGPLKNHWVPEERERGPEPRDGNDWRLCVNASCLK